MARPMTLRCTTSDGKEIARIVLDARSSFVATALKAVIGDRPSGTITAESFARRAFSAISDREQRQSARDRIILRHLRALDGLALTAVTRDIPATITWELPA